MLVDLERSRFQKCAAWALAAVPFAGLTFVGVKLWSNRDFYGWPRALPLAASASSPASSELQITEWLWPTDAAKVREALPEGALVVHDDAADYFSEYFGRHLTGRVQYLSTAHPKAFADEVYARKAALVGVRKGSLAEGELKARGAKWLAEAPRTAEQLYTLGY